MNRLSLIALTLVGAANGFMPVSRTSVPRTVVFDQDTLEDMPTIPTIERGVSVDQDGKSNVWAIEPKMELSDKTNEEKTQSALIAGGGIAAFAVFAGIALTNLPDPNQF